MIRKLEFSKKNKSRWMWQLGELYLYRIGRKRNTWVLNLEVGSSASQLDSAVDLERAVVSGKNSATILDWL